METPAMVPNEVKKTDHDSRKGVLIRNSTRKRRRGLVRGLLAGGLLIFFGLVQQAQAAAPAQKAPQSRQTAGLPKPGDPKFVRALLAHLDDLQRGKQSQALMSMEVKTKHWTRRLAMESWSLGSAYSLIRIREPKKEQGTASLKVKDDLFTYLAKTGRTIKVSGAMMGGAWMGSHFTNDDLVRASRFSEAFTSKLTFDGKVKGVGIYRIELVPKPDAPVVWGKIEVTVRKRDLQPLLQVYFDEDGKKVRAMKFSKYKSFGGRMMPTVMVVQPLDGSGEYTKLEYLKMDFNVSLKPDFFSIQRLKKM